MDRSTSESVRLLDRVAITLSGLCVLHCLAMPLLLIMLPFIGQISEDHFHLQMLLLVIPVSSFALLLGFRRHRHTGTLIGGIAGMLLLLAGGTWVHSEIGLLADRLTTIAGSLLLATAHFYNSRFSRSRRINNSE